MSGQASGPVELLSRARAFVDAGDHAAVVRLLEAVERALLLAHPELGYHLAYALRRGGRAAEALPLVQALEVPVRRSANAWLLRRRANLEAMLQYDLGRLDQARELWEQVTYLAGGAEDDQLLSAAYNNLGVLDTLQDQVESALASYQRALLAARAQGDGRGVAMAHQNLAILYRELARTDDAETHFEDALREARRVGSEDVRGRVEEERALLQLDTGDAPLAAATAGRALRRFTAIGDVAGEGEALRVLGIVALRERRTQDAHAQLERALGIAREIGNPLLEAESLEALACLARVEQDEQAAEQHHELARDRFSDMRAEPWGRRIRARTIALTGAAS